MKFHEAREKANEGDKLKLFLAETGKRGQITTKILASGKGNFTLSFEQYDSEQWQIIPAEPVVLSVEEWLKKNVAMKFLIGDFTNVIIECSEFFHQNGRLERNKELQPVIEAAEKLHDIAPVYGVASYTSEFFNAVKNMPPLNKND